MGCVAREPLLGREDARDLAADVVAAVLPRMGQLNAPLRYVVTMCRHRLIRFLTGKRTRARLQSALSEAVWPETPPAEAASFDDSDLRKLALIRSLLSGTDHLTRQVILLRSETDFTYAQIAALVDCRPATIRMRALRFSGRVRDAWERQSALAGRDSGVLR